MSVRREYDDPVEAQATEWMLAAKNGDREAFDRLTVSLRNRAFRVASSLVGSREDALELAQEAFMKTYRARETFRDGEPFLPWFHRILRNTCFSFLRKHKRIKHHSIHLEHDGEETEWLLQDEGPPPFEAAEKDEARTAFWDSFGTLAARDREILGLRHFQDQTYREIAHALDVPEGTVMSRLFHARRRLRDALAPHLSNALQDYRHAATEVPTEKQP